MEEVSPEDQAAMAVQLHENVRQLIRDEVKAALEDHGFVVSLNATALVDRVLYAVTAHSAFRDGVKRVVQEQMSKW